MMSRPGLRVKKRKLKMSKSPLSLTFVLPAYFWRKVLDEEFCISNSKNLDENMMACEVTGINYPTDAFAPTK